jgi:prepilin-type N-terminal cleavage/methylation domain-containing protein
MRKALAGNGGFTLVELTLVMAITGALAVIALVGQRALNEQQRFDAKINGALQAMNYARNYATSNINEAGAGNSTTSVFVGTTMEFDNNHDQADGLLEMEPVYGANNGIDDPDPSTYDTLPPGDLSACAPYHSADSDECFEKYFNDTSGLQIATAGVNSIYVAFINTREGLKVCHQVSSTGVSLSNACTRLSGTPFQISLTDGNGHHATIEIDPNNGIVRRVN